MPRDLLAEKKGEPRDLLAGKEKVWSGSVLPFSKDASGKVSFDSNAGLLGLGKNALKGLWSGATLPGDVYAGRVDPRSDEAIARATNLAAIASPVNPAVRAGDMAIPGALRATRPAEVAAPSVPALKQAADRGYTQARGMGVEYNPAAVAQMADRVRAQLQTRGITPEDAASTFKKLDLLANPPPGAKADFIDLESARKAFGETARNFNNPTDQLGASISIRAIDDFLENPTAQGVVAGPARELAAVAKDARANYAAAARSKEVAGREQKALRRAAASNSGANIDNALRQRIASLLDSPKLSSGFSPEERALMEGFVAGKGGRNAVRSIANLLGGGGGMGRAVVSGMGAAAGVPFGPTGAAIGAAIPAGTGALLKELENVMARRGIRAIDEAVRSRSPLYETMKQGAPMTVISPEGRAAIIRALMLEANAN